MTRGFKLKILSSRFRSFIQFNFSVAVDFDNTVRNQRQRSELNSSTNGKMQRCLSAPWLFRHVKYRASCYGKRGSRGFKYCNGVTPNEIEMSVRISLELCSHKDAVQSR